MLYYLFDYINKIYDPPGFEVFRFLTFRSAIAAITGSVAELLQVQNDILLSDGPVIQQDIDRCAHPCFFAYHDAFGVAGGSRGIYQGAQIIFVDFDYRIIS